MSFFTYNIKNFVNLHIFSSLYANFRRTGAEQRVKTLQNCPLQRLFWYGIVINQMYKGHKILQTPLLFIKSMLVCLHTYYMEVKTDGYG